MSKYFNVKGLKVRISDHEPNEKLRGSSDIELYITDACGKVISVESQIEAICEKRSLNANDFDLIAEEFKDGSYDADFFKTPKNDDSDCESCDFAGLNALKDKMQSRNIHALAGCHLSSSASHAEIKKLSELTGVSQAFIKKHFGCR